MDPSDFTLDDLLIHVPLEDWPLPDKRQCPISYCKEAVNRNTLDNHLREKHEDLYQKGGFHSEFHTTVAGLLGMELPDGNAQVFTCPIPHCTNTYFDDQTLAEHMQQVHNELTRTLYDNIGGFWTVITLIITGSTPDELGFIRWPTIKELFQGENDEQVFFPFPVSPERADQLWHSSTTFSFHDIPFMDQTPLENLLKDYFDYVSKEGLEIRYRNTMQVLGKHCRANTAKIRTIKAERVNTNLWLDSQRLLTPLSIKEIHTIIIHIYRLNTLLAADEHSHQEAESELAQSLNDVQNTEDEAQMIENARQWISLHHSESDNEQEQEIPIDPLNQDLPLVALDALEHDNLAEEERTPPRLTHSSISTPNSPPPPIQPFSTHCLLNNPPQDNPPPHPNLPLSEALITRANQLMNILHDTLPSSIDVQLEEFLSDLADNPIQESDRTLMSLDTPVILALVQSKAYRICRKTIFCPFEDCRSNTFDSIPKLSNHLHAKHYYDHNQCADIIQFFIEQMFHKRLKTKIFTRNSRGEEELIDTDIALKRCYLPMCTAAHSKNSTLFNHIKNRKHTDLMANIDLLGWFWGIIKLNTSQHPLITIRELLKESEAYQCTVENCCQIFPSHQGLMAHSTSQHNDNDRPQWRTPYQKIWLKTELIDESPNSTSNLSEPNPNPAHPTPSITRIQSFSHDIGILRPLTAQDTDLEMVRRQELNNQHDILKQFYIRKRGYLIDLVESGVNLPLLNKKDKHKLIHPLRDLFKEDIIPSLEEMMPNAEDWDSWLAFEGAFEVALDKIRMLIIATKGRNPKTLYGPRTLNTRLQLAREQTSEILRKHQATQHQLRKVKFFLQEIAESSLSDQDPHREPELNRRITEWTRKIAPILDAIPEEKRREVFGDVSSHEGIWDLLNNSPDHRINAINWLESLIMTELEGELRGMADILHTHMVRDDYNTRKSIAMRRHITKKYSPPCAINKDRIHDFFQNSWASPPQNFQEANIDSPFFLKSKIPEEAAIAMEEFMLNEKNISEVIRSRADIGACGPDGINNSILKAVGVEGIHFLKLLTQACITCGRVFESWKKAKTILIYKKGDREDPQNWRPISITNCLYRDFTCLMSRCFQDLNSTYKLFSDHQKGFIKKTNGCTEHGIILNELFHDARRNNKELVITAVDFTNAFGSVPHELILSAMKQRNCPEWTRNIVRDMYTNASSYIELAGDKSQPISWKKGVKQGCPLSPLLFNLCLEPLIQTIKTVNKGYGAYVDIDENTRVENLIQAYADDVALISQKPEGIKAMLKTLETFTKWAKMDVNVKKCTTASYLLDQDHHRYSLTQNLKFNNQEIPNLTLNQSIKYLGTALSARRNVKLNATNYKFDEMKVLVHKILNSPLLTVQKIDAIKTFVIPCFDFLMLNGDLSRTRLRETDSYIRGELNKMLKIPGLPKECHHMSWRDGGFSIPSLLDRSYVLSICSFAHMFLSKDPSIRAMTCAFIESERRFRQIPIDDVSIHHFLNWKDEKGERGTASFINNTRRAVKHLKVHLHSDFDKLTISESGKELKTTSPSKIGRFLTQKVIRPVLAQEMTKHPDKGASFHTLIKNECSNTFLRNSHTYLSDAFFRFAVAARTNSLPTLANIGKWYPNENIDDTCHRCDSARKSTLAHILNGCNANFPLMTDRHNRVVRCVRTAIEKLIPSDLVGQIYENTPVQVSGLSENSIRLRPDMWFVRKEDGNEIIEILEFSCPYGCVEDNIISLDRVFGDKFQKYTNLAEEISHITSKPAKVHPIIISSLGAIHNESITHLRSILRCKDKDLKKLGIRMSEQAIMGSFKLWIEFQKINNHRYNKQEEEEIILANQENIENLENEENHEEEEDKEEETGEQEINPNSAVDLAIMDSIETIESDTEHEISLN
jgi:hypothetical protein